MGEPAGRTSSWCQTCFHMQDTPTGHTDTQSTSVAQEEPQKGEKLYHSLFWGDPFGKDDHINRSILGDGIVFETWTISGFDFLTNGWGDVFGFVCFFLEAGEQIHHCKQHDLKQLFGLQDTDLLFYWNGISIFTLLPHHNFHKSSCILSGRNENPLSFLKLRWLLRADHLQLLKKLSRWKEPEKGKGKKNLYHHKQHHCRPKGD